MADEEATNQVREALRQWISADDEIRALQAQIKTIRDRKNALSGQVLEYMRTQNIDNLVLEGPGGTIARQQRTVRPALRRDQIRTQLLLQFADQPHRVAEALRAIEGIPEGTEDMSVGGTVRELLTRRMPRSQQIRLG
jgi:seryl-tRNA synthetase